MTPVEAHTVHPAAARPRLALAVCFLLGLVGSAAWQFLPEPLVTLPLLGFLAWSVLPFFLPTRYELGDALRVTFLGQTRVYSWERFRAFVPGRRGVLLTPYRQRRTALRGVWLPTETIPGLRQRGLDERVD